MRVYVAGRTTDIERVNRVQALLREAGHEISFDWTENPEEGIRHDWELAPDEAQARALTELCAVKYNSDAVVLCALDGIMGAAMETGMAMALNLPVAVLDAHRDSVFFYLPFVSRCDEDNLIETLEDLRQLRWGGRGPRSEPAMTPGLTITQQITLRGELEIFADNEGNPLILVDGVPLDFTLTDQIEPVDARSYGRVRIAIEVFRPLSAGTGAPAETHRQADPRRPTRPKSAQGPLQMPRSAP